MRNCRLIFIIFLFSLTMFSINTIKASPFLLDELSHLESVYTKELPVPNPVSLDPQWWNYFNVDGDELKRRTAVSQKVLQEFYVTLPLEDQTVASPLINKIIATLNALAQAKAIVVEQAPISRAFLKNYTLEKQLGLNREMRKLKADIINEQGRLEQLKARLSKAQKNIDNLLVAYLAQTQPSSKKAMIGLEIMTHRANVGLGEQNQHMAERRLEELEEKLKIINEELEYSKEHLDVHEFSEKQLEKNIALAQKEIDNKQNEFVAAEENILGLFSDNPNERNNHFLLEQQLLQASVNKAYAWSKLSFQIFKFNFVMHLNAQFQEGHRELRENLTTWREKISKIVQQSQEWKISAIKEQERIRQEDAFSIARNERTESQQIRFNQSLRQGVLNILTTLELLDDEIANTEWLIGQLEDDFSKKSTFIENWWVGFKSSLVRSWTKIVNTMNFSLFKVSGIPITLMTLLKIIIIISLSFWLSVFVRSSLKAFGKKRGDITESTLYSLGSLAHYFILLVGLIIALCSMGLDFSSLIIIAGALTFGLSFGLQSIAENFFCGLRILFERKLKIGDDVELHSGHHGKVTEIHVQNTVVRTSDGQKVIVPNSELIGNTLVNWTRHNYDHRRLHIPFAVAAGADKDLVRQLVIDAAKRVPCSLRGLPEYADPQLWLVSFSSFALEFKLVVWVDYDGDTVTDSKEADFLWEIESVLRLHEIPLPSTMHYLFPNMRAPSIE